MPQLDVAVLVASTRTGSINQKLTNALIRLAPANLAFRQVRMDHLPFYSGDLEPGRTADVNAFTAELTRADAALIVTPEYNRSIPAVLKNAIDWGSKPMDKSVWRDLPIAMTGASPGSMGTALAQQHLRQILSIVSAHVLPGEVYIGFNGRDLISDDGTVNDPSTEAFLKGFMDRFGTYAARFRS